jgi:hypothetical protein
VNTTTLAVLALPALCLVLIVVALVAWASQTLVESGRKKEAWPAFAKAIDAQYGGSAAGKPDQVTGRIDEWPFMLDTYVAGTGQGLIQYTRLRAFFVPRLPFEAVIYTSEEDDELPGRATLTSVTVASLGSGITVKSTDAVKLEALLSDAALVQCIRSAMPVNLQIRRRRNWQGGGVSNGIYEVHAQHRGVIADAARLQALHALVAECLRALHRAGFAARSLAD